MVMGILITGDIITGGIITGGIETGDIEISDGITTLFGVLIKTFTLGILIFTTLTITDSETPIETIILGAIQTISEIAITEEEMQVTAPTEEASWLILKQLQAEETITRSALHLTEEVLHFRKVLTQLEEIPHHLEIREVRLQEESLKEGEML